VRIAATTEMLLKSANTPKSDVENIRVSIGDEANSISWLMSVPAARVDTFLRKGFDEKR
jgi:hypothetical protein